jgi:hypothetical protein
MIKRDTGLELVTAFLAFVGSGKIRQRAVTADLRICPEVQIK